MKYIYIVIGLFFIHVELNAQDSTVIKAKELEPVTEVKDKSPLTILGYLEAYYAYNSSRPENHQLPGFLYNFNQHNEVNLNLGFLKANYSGDKVRGNIALMAGTYAQYNLAAEQPLLRNVYEANAGVKISGKSNLWVDAGIMPSHIGFESAIGKDCWILTRSIMAENSPYYEAGVKLGYTTKSGKFYLAAIYLNGWQRIQRINGNQTPAFGTQLTYKPNSKITFNWSTFVGNEQPDSLRKMRYFNNFYGVIQITEKFGLVAGFDLGIQQKAKNSNSYDVWYTPVFIARYSITDKIRIAARGEYYSDKNQVMIVTGTPDGFQTFGYSLNFDYVVMENVLFRIEGRGFSSKDKIFTLDNKPNSQNYFATTSIAISF